MSAPDIMTKQQYMHTGINEKLILEGVRKATDELSRPGSTLNINTKTYSINDPVDAIALSYYHAMRSNVGKSAMFAKRALELCNVTNLAEIDSLIELSINSSAMSISNMFWTTAEKVDSLARKEFFEKMRRIEEPFPTD